MKKQTKLYHLVFWIFPLISLLGGGVLQGISAEVFSSPHSQEVALEINVSPEPTPPAKATPSPASKKNYNLEMGVELKDLKKGLAEVIPNRQGILKISFENALKLALLNNLRTLVAQEQTREAKGTYQRALSGMLPNLSATVTQSRRTSNIVAEGLDPSSVGLPSGVFGPYNSFDARVSLLQNIFDLSAIGTLQAGSSNLRLSKIKLIVAQQRASNKAALAYVQVLEAQENVKAVEADLELSETLLMDTRVAFDAGIVTGVDLMRAEANYSKNTTRLIKAKTQLDSSVLNLKGLLLLPMGSTLDLTTPLKGTGPQPPGVNEAVSKALANRPDLQLVREEVKFLGYQHRAAVGKQVPSIGFGANYGGSGLTPTDGTAGVYQLGGQISIPIFDGGNTIGEIREAKSKQRQAKILLSNLLQQTDKEVRLALDKIKYSRQEIISAEKTLAVTLKELELTRERFFAGVGDNLEVVQAQSSLAEARNSRIQALGDYNSAWIDLATALGEMDSFQL